MRKYTILPSFVHERSDEIEVSSKNVDGIGMILSYLVEKIQEGFFFIWKLRPIDISDPTIKISAKRMKVSRYYVARGYKFI